MGDDGRDRVMRELGVIRHGVRWVARNGRDLYRVDGNRPGGMWRRNECFPDDEGDGAVVQDAIFWGGRDMEDGVDRRSLEAGDRCLVRHGLADVQPSPRREREKTDG